MAPDLTIPASGPAPNQHAVVGRHPFLACLGRVGGGVKWSLGPPKVSCKITGQIPCCYLHLVTLGTMGT
jgi:hypothetical protein